MKVLIPIFEGFLTYGGMSTREMEAVAIGLEESTDIDMISHGPEFIAEFARILTSYNIPIVTPPGGLGLHINARDFVGHINPLEYQAASLAAAIYIVSGARGMERGTLSEGEFLEYIKALLPGKVKSGEFGADMKVSLINDGPVTILLDTAELMDTPRHK